jgi:hypothetical protein
MKTRSCFALLPLGLTLMFISFVGCQEFDSTDIWEKITDLDNRLTRLEEKVDKMNSNINGLQEIVIALQNNDAVTGIVTLPDNSGYTIVFVSGKEITLYNGTNGTNGENGHSPIVSIKQDTDGEWYWTLDGEWLIVDGEKVRAAAKDGENGKDGITPKLKVEDGYWYISYDNGATWNQLGKATGENGKDGDNLLKGIEILNGYLIITLNDVNSTVVQLPLVTDEEPVVKTGDANNIGADHAFLDGYCNREGVEGASVYYGVQISSYDLNSIDWPLWYMLRSEPEGYSWYNNESYSGYSGWIAFAGNHEDPYIKIGNNIFLYLGKDKDNDGHYTIMADYLSYNTKYYYRSFVYDGVYTYGETKSFTTPDLLVSSITTEEATEVEKFTATLHASCDANAFIDQFDTGFLLCSHDFILNNVIAEKRIDFTISEYTNDLTCNRILVQQSALPPSELDANIQYLKAGTVYYYVSFIRFGETVLYGGIKSFSTPSYYSGQEIQMDGDFSDWDLLDPSKIATATCDPEAFYTALEIVKVYANEGFIFVYFEWDKTQISHGNGERVPFHCYINTDGDTTTGGYADWGQSGGFTDACSDVVLEGFLYDNYGYLGSYSPWSFAWSGEPNGTGWNWDTSLKSFTYGFAMGAGVEGQYELAISREALAYNDYPISDEFSIGFDIQQSWTSMGLLPNAAATTENPCGYASSLKIGVSQ